MLLQQEKQILSIDKQLFRSTLISMGVFYGHHFCMNLRLLVIAITVMPLLLCNKHAEKSKTAGKIALSSEDTTVQEIQSKKSPPSILKTSC